MDIGILGANGFLGSVIVDRLKEKHNVTPITRENYLEVKNQKFDTFINVAGNKKSYLANQYPAEDFKVSTLPVYESIVDFKFDQYIFMSSIATYDNTSQYGFNKILSEQIIKRFVANHLILRCCAVIDKSSEIGVIADIKTNKPLFVSPTSTYQFITRAELANVIFNMLLHRLEGETINVGGLGSVEIQDIEKIINRPIIYKEQTIERHYEMDVTRIRQICRKIKTSEECVKDILL